jgi:peptide/nickel transport system substrate-binding protein
VPDHERDWTAGGNVATSLRARHRSTITAMVVVFAIAAAACSSSSSKGTGGGKNTTTPTTAGTAKSGGSVTFALPAETSGGWCLQEGQLAISGIQIARAIYDTLVVPDVNEKYKPFLAQSVTGNAANTVWTIKVRPGIKFHDGTNLDGKVVQNNIDAYRGKYPGRSPLLF